MPYRENALIITPSNEAQAVDYLAFMRKIVDSMDKSAEKAARAMIEDIAKLKKLSAEFGGYISVNQIIRDAVRAHLAGLVYTNPLNTQLGTYRKVLRNDKKQSKNINFERSSFLSISRR